MTVDLDTLLSDSTFVAVVNIHDLYKLLKYQKGDTLTLRGLPVLLSDTIPQGKADIIEVKRER